MEGNYLEYTFSLVPNEEFVRDILMQEIAEAGFDSFQENETGFIAYALETKFAEDVFDKVIAALKEDYNFSYIVQNVPNENWNEVWESNFKPIVIGNQIYVHADFHPLENYPISILIHPKMAFGTGHHETTFQVAEQMLRIDFLDKVTLDMGCGTALLAILAHKLGATNITAIDNDPVAVESAIENAKMNGLNDARIFCGEAAALSGYFYDVILANINRNILIQDMAAYAAALNPNGHILFSGFYTEDLDMITDSAEANGLAYVHSSSKNNWVVATFIKK
jgi:ribosomal protein L11 methyltransferase